MYAFIDVIFYLVLKNKENHALDFEYLQCKHVIIITKCKWIHEL